MRKRFLYWLFLQWNFTVWMKKGAMKIVIMGKVPAKQILRNVSAKRGSF
jgi:hypothetical protein